MLNVELCGLGFNGNKLVAQLFGLPFKFCLQLFLPLGVSGIPNGLVIFDLVFDHGVKDHCDLMGGCHGGSLGAQLGFHSTQVVAQGRDNHDTFNGEIAIHFTGLKGLDKPIVYIPKACGLFGVWLHDVHRP